MKRCSRCRKTKTRTEFCARKDARDGLQSWCKDCQRDYMRGRPSDPLRRNANAKISAKRHPARRRARESVQNAIRSGRMPPARALACVDCGKSADAYDHHAGYSRALEVQAVCHVCHGLRSRKRGEHRRRA